VAAAERGDGPGRGGDGPGLGPLEAGMAPAQSRLSRVLFGRALPTSVAAEQRLSNPVGLAILSSDALSSVAYATEEMTRVLLPVIGLAAFSVGLPITGVIVGLLLLLVFSYRQTIQAYPNAGGAYVVTRDNFGLLPAQCAGVALLLDYIMTVAVSVSAGVAALYSYFSPLFAVRIPLAVALIWLIAWVNLRGARATGKAFAAPTYAFLVCIGALLAVGVVRAGGGTLHATPAPHAVATTMGSLSLLLVLHAYASGTTALTGVEAISNGVTVFRPPEATNGRRVLLTLGLLLAVSFGGIALLSWRVHPVPTAKRTLISQLGRNLFGSTTAGHAALGALQIATTAILVLAANTSFSDFPRLASFHAGDGYLPRTLRRQGPRLSFVAGIATLALLSTVVVIALGADVDRLIPLYAVGVFASFTFSQAGMTRRHLRLREESWRRGLVINALGAVGSGLALIAILIAKFLSGAWVIVILVPAGVFTFVRVHRHYEQVRSWLAGTDVGEVTVAGTEVLAPGADVAGAGRPVASARWLGDPVVGATALVLVEAADRRAALGVAVARALGIDDVRPVLVDHGTDPTSPVVDAWPRTGLPDLEVLASPYREAGGPLRWKIDTLPAATVTVIVPRVHEGWVDSLLYGNPARAPARQLGSRPDVGLLALDLHR
jgi:amino acid transporter